MRWCLFIFAKNIPAKTMKTGSLNTLNQKRLIGGIKMGDSGSEHFAIDFYDEAEKKEKLFYPDWIIAIKGLTLILDTKTGSNWHRWFR